MNKVLGYWHEYRGIGDSIYDTDIKKLEVRNNPNQTVLQYLESGLTFSKIRTYFRCIFTGDNVGLPFTYTDGEWVWTTEYIYYYKNYNFKIDPLFEKKILQGTETRSNQRLNSLD